MTKQDVAGVITIEGRRPGKTLTILGGVHGDETCGVQALDALTPNLRIDAGRVHLIYGNLRAIALGKRQTEMNLNRAFRPDPYILPEERTTYERQRALEIMPFIEKSDALLDVHSTRNPEGEPFIICEPHSFPIARQLPFPIRSYGWDAIEPGGTDYYMNRQGGLGICIECGYHSDPAAPQRAEESIRTFLAVMGATPAVEPKEYDQRVVHAYGIYYTKTNFRRARPFMNFAPVPAGELIGSDGDVEVRVRQDAVLIFCQDEEGPGEEAFILAREDR